MEVSPGQSDWSGFHTIVTAVLPDQIHFKVDDLDESHARILFTDILENKLGAMHLCTLNHNLRAIYYHKPKTQPYQRYSPSRFYPTNSSLL